MRRFFKRISIYMIFSALLINLFACAKSKDEILETGHFPYNSFRELPGVTQKEIKAIEVLQRRGQSFVYGSLETTEAFYDQDNNIKGYTALLCEWLTDFFGIQFNPAIFEWGDLIAGLETGEIDFTGELSPTRERQEKYFMSDPIAVRPIKYMRLKGAPLSEIADERLVRLAFLHGSTTYSYVSKAEVFEKFEAFFVNDIATAYELLKTNKIDAFVEDGVIETAFDIYGDVISENFFPMTFDSMSISTQKAELEPIISVCRKIYKIERGQILSLLYNQGYKDYLKHKLFLNLTDSEKDFLKNQTVIKYGAELDNYPVCFYNSREHQLQGIAIDVLKEITELAGIIFEPVFNDSTQWSNMNERLETGEISFVTELIKTKDRQKRFIWPQSILMKDKYALLSKVEYRNIDIKEVIFLKIGLIRNSAYTEYFNSLFPNHGSTEMYDTLGIAINAMNRGEIDMVMSTNHQFLILTNYLELSGYKVNLMFDDSYDVAFGFNKNEKLLCSIIDKTFSFIDTEGISGQWLRKNFDYRIKLLQARIIGIGATAVLILGILFFSVLFYKKRLESKWLENLVKDRTAELEATRDEARAANIAKSSFLANMSHEIRTPMNSIIGFSELAQDDEISLKTKLYLSNIKTNGEWLLQIINDILDISKIESGKFELEKTPFDFHELFSSCKNLVLPQAIEKKIELNLFAEPFLNKTLLGDPKRLRQVLVNLLSNSVKFTDSGFVELSSKIIKQTENSITLKFEVADSGIGMTEEEINKIFEPFAQASTGTSSKYGGTGLGLAISKNIVEKMGGVLSVESKLEQGSKFSFELTFGTIEATEENLQVIDKEDQEIEKPDLEGEVLLCEDDEMNQLVLAEHLKKVGLDVKVAKDGKAGVDMVQERKENKEKQFDLIFMDMVMPVMDGLDAALAIKRIDENIPVVAITASITDKDKKAYRKNELNGFVGKPFSSQELWKCLLKYFTPKK